ncbi:hypothetical protein ACNHYB_06100 [Isoptericola jiangsuensis]|uniref:hypothetical protein n=1 Tax=Isoptericola jiangsuensis TaxID=548579 RepID=UPI003AAEC481
MNHQGEEGRILLLTVGFLAVGLMLVAAVASAASVHLDRKHLFDLADSLAVAGADSARAAAHYAGAEPGESGSDVVIVLSDAEVAREVSEHLASQPGTTAPGLRGVQVAEATSPDGRSARVTLVATSHPPLLRWFTDSFTGGFALTATATARAG